MDPERARQRLSEERSRVEEALASLGGEPASDEPGNFAELLLALRKGETYTNVHTTTRAPGGEIRGQNKRGRGHDQDD